MKRWSLLLVVALLLPLVLAACQGGGGQAKDTIVLGAAISLTGKTAKEGEYTLNGYQMAIEEINKAGGVKVGGKTYKLELKYYDDESNPDTSAKLVEKLITEDKVDFLLGPYGSGPTYSTSAIAEKYKVPMVEANGASEKIFSRGFKYTFGVLSPAGHYLRGILDLVTELDPNVKTVAIVMENGAFAISVAEGAKKHAESKGLQVVYFEKYPKGTQDVSPLLTAIKGLNPDIILGAGHLQDTILIMKQLKDLGISPKAVGFSVGPASPEFRKALGDDANFVFGAAQWTPSLKYQADDVFGTPQKFAEMYQAKHGYVPPYQAAESAAAIIVYKAAIEKAGSLDREKVRDALSDLNIMTFYGPVKFNEQGMNLAKPMAVEQLFPDGGKYTVYPLDVAEKEPLYPFVPWDQR